MKTSADMLLRVYNCLLILYGFSEYYNHNCHLVSINSCDVAMNNCPCTSGSYEMTVMKNTAFICQICLKYLKVTIMNTRPYNQESN